MRCEDVRELIPLCVGHDLSAEEETAVCQHAAACPECAHELKEYRLIGSTLGQMKEGEAPVGTWENMWSGVRQRTVAPSKVIRFNLDAALRVAAAALIGVGLGFFGSLLLRHDVRTENPGSPAIVDNGALGPIGDSPTTVKDSSLLKPNAGKSPIFSPWKVPQFNRGKSEETFYLPAAEIIVPIRGGEVKF